MAFDHNDYAPPVLRVTMGVVGVAEGALDHLTMACGVGFEVCVWASRVGWVLGTALSSVDGR